MNVIINAKVMSNFAGKNQRYLTVGDMETFSQVKVNIPLSENVIVGTSYRIEAEIKVGKGKSGDYLDFSNVKMTKIGGEK